MHVYMNDLQVCICLHAQLWFSVMLEITNVYADLFTNAAVDLDVWRNQKASLEVLKKSI